MKIRSTIGLWMVGMFGLRLDKLKKADRLLSTMKYKVWFGKGPKFYTMEEATRYAGFIYRKTGVVVAVTVVNR